MTNFDICSISYALVSYSHNPYHLSLAKEAQQGINLDNSEELVDTGDSPDDLLLRVNVVDDLPETEDFLVLSDLDTIRLPRERTLDDYSKLYEDPSYSDAVLISNDNVEFANVHKVSPQRSFTFPAPTQSQREESTPCNFCPRMLVMGA